MYVFAGTTCVRYAEAKERPGEAVPKAAEGTTCVRYAEAKGDDCLTITNNNGHNLRAVRRGKGYDYNDLKKKLIGTTCVRYAEAKS